MVHCPKATLTASYLEVREMKKTHQCNIKKGKHLFLLACASLDVISVEIINPRLSGRSEFKILCNIVCIFHKLCHNFVLKTNLFFSFIELFRGTPVSIVEHFIQGFSFFFIFFKRN